MKKSSISRRKKSKRFRKNVLTKKRKQIQKGGNPILTFVKKNLHKENGDISDEKILSYFPLEISRTDLTLDKMKLSDDYHVFYDTNNYYYKRLPLEKIKENIKSQVEEFQKSQFRIESIKHGMVEEISEDQYNELTKAEKEKFIKDSRMSGYNIESYYKRLTQREIDENLKKTPKWRIENLSPDEDYFTETEYSELLKDATFNKYKFVRDSKSNGYSSETYYRRKTFKDDIKESIENYKDEIRRNIKSKPRYDISSVKELPQFSVIQDEYNLLDPGKYIQLSKGEYNVYAYLVQAIENNLKQLKQLRK